MKLNERRKYFWVILYNITVKLTKLTCKSNFQLFQYHSRQSLLYLINLFCKFRLRELTLTPAASVKLPPQPKIFWNIFSRSIIIFLTSSALSTTNTLSVPLIATQFMASCSQTSSSNEESVRFSKYFICIKNKKKDYLVAGNKRSKICFGECKSFLCYFFLYLLRNLLEF